MQSRKVIALLVTITLIFTVLTQPLFVYGLESGRGGNSGKSGGSGSGVHETEEGLPREDSGESDHGGSGSSGKGKGQGGRPAQAGTDEHETDDDEPHEGSGGSGKGKGSSGNSGNGKGQGDSSSTDNGRGGTGGGKPPVNKGSILLEVIIEWQPTEVQHPKEVYITLYNSETDFSTTVLTEGGKATFYTEPGDEWWIIGEAIPGFKVPEKRVTQMTGTDEVVQETLFYEVGGADAKEVILNKTNIVLFVNDSIQLTARIEPGNASQEVVWTTSDEDVVEVKHGMVKAVSEGEAEITARSIDNENITATCKVKVKPIDDLRVTGISILESHIELILSTANNTKQLHAIVSPADATVQDVFWESENQKIAKVDEFGNVTGIAVGSTVITVTTIDGGFEAYTRVSVCEPVEIEYIYPTLENEVETEHFEDPFDVYINVVNLVDKLKADESMTADGVLYYVKVMEKGSTVPLGEGEVLLESDTREFNLYEVTNFKETENNSSRYFVYMSQDENFPKSDEQTLMTNFMGGTSTPTIPLENINVSLIVHGGDRADKLEGIYFILAREEYEEGLTLDDVSWKDFYIGGKNNAPKDPYAGEEIDENWWVDEVKVTGKTDENGIVVWDEPRETVKLGGYLLLEVTPLEYDDNLNDPDTASDDGELLKQVLFKRDGGLDRVVQNIYIGQEEQIDGITLNPTHVTLTIGELEEFEFEVTTTPGDEKVTDVVWTSIDEKIATVNENGKVNAVFPGYTIINATTKDGLHEAYARVTVIEQPEIEYIYPIYINEEGEEEDTEHFDNPYLVNINVEKLVKKLIEDGIMKNTGVLYYVKVVEKGKAEKPLGEGEITLYHDTIKFNLYDITKFAKTENYSNRYFVYMSQDENFPKDDEKTLMTNFMGGTATPTIPKENVQVDLKVYGGGSPEGIIFLLTREEIDDNKTIEEITWRDFYINGYENAPKDPNEVGTDDWVDEVKMVGVTDKNGIVVWIEPRETLKLGGYLLLQVTPSEYEDNLNDPDTTSDDGELLKQVHLMRDGFIYRKVVNIYIGENTNSDEENNDSGNDDIIDNQEEDPKGDSLEDIADEPEEDAPSNRGTSKKPKSNTSSTIVSLNNIEEHLVTLKEVEEYSGHWAKKYLDDIILRGLIQKSFFHDNFCLNDNIDKIDLLSLLNSIRQGDKFEYDELDLNNNLITREQAIVILMQTFGFDQLENVELNFVDKNDIDENIIGYIGKAVELGIANGYPDNTFRPKLNITFGELFSMLSRCLTIQ